MAFCHSPRGECGLKFFGRIFSYRVKSHSPRGECGLKFFPPCTCRCRHNRHSPRGECGLKFSCGRNQRFRGGSSLPARGVWIEIENVGSRGYDTFRHSPRGECGLKYFGCVYFCSRSCHSPRGECGLKFEVVRKDGNNGDVTPLAGSVD